MYSAYNAAVGKESWTTSRASSWIGCNIHCGVCILLANSRNREGHWTGCAQEVIYAGSVFSLKFWIVGVLLFGVFFAASRGSTVLKSVVFLDSDAYGFGARVFDCRDVRISLLNLIDISDTRSCCLPAQDKFIDAIRWDEKVDPRSRMALS